MRALLSLLLLTLLTASVVAGETNTDYDSTWKKAIEWLRKNQAEDGSWSKNMGKVGSTGVVLEALAMAPEKIRTKEVKAMMESASKYLISKQQKKGAYAGAIFDTADYANYCTCLAVMALTKYDRKRFEPQIRKAVIWIKRQQATPARGFDPGKHKGTGGFGYGSSLRQDLSNTWIALDALKAAGVPDDDPVWELAKTFVKRCQNSPEVSDQPTAGKTGNAVYLPGESPAGTVTGRDGRVTFKGYGSMTYAMLLSYLWCDVKKDDLPVKLATKWLGDNFTVDKNTNTRSKGQQGLFYYYRVMSKSLDAYGEEEFAGHKWREELAAAIVKRQQKDGSWFNEADRWGEGDPALVTGYTLTALATCQKVVKKKEK